MICTVNLQKNKWEEIEKPKAPKKPLPPYFMFKEDVMEQTKQAYPGISLLSLIKIIAERWKTADDQIKEFYEQRYEDDKRRYEENINASSGKYVKHLLSVFQPTEPVKEPAKEPESPVNSTNSTAISETEEENQSIPLPLSQKGKEEALPQNKPLAPFFQFKEESFEQLKMANPGKHSTQLTQIVANKWKELDQETKKVYEQNYEEAKKKYEQKQNANMEKRGKGGENKKRKVDVCDTNNVENNQSNNVQINNPLSGFFLFQAHVFERVKQAYPNNSLSDILRIIAIRWEGLDVEIRRKYENVGKTENTQNKGIKNLKRSLSKQKVVLV